MERKDVDINLVSPMMREYLNTKKDYEGIILFYRLGDFYEMFFDDAIKVSHELELTLTGKQAGLEERIPMCGVPYHAANMYIEKLIEKGFKVAICEQMEDAKQAKGIVKREVIKIVSAGTLTDPSLVNEKDFNYIASLTDYKYTYALTYADILTGKIFTTFISYDEDKLISKLVNLNIKELIVNSDFDIELSHVLNTNYNIYVSRFDDYSEYNNRNIFINIKDDKLIRNTTLLLNYMLFSQKQDLSHMQYVEYVDSKLFLELDKECIRNLELTETVRNKDRSNSLLGFMDKTKTAMGSRMLKSFIISPSIDKNEIEKRHDMVGKLIDSFLLKSELKELLFEIYDLERLTGKVICATLNARDMLQLKNSIKVIPDINNILKNLGFNELETFHELYELLDFAINEDPPITIKEGNIIKSGYNNEVDELRKIKKSGKDFISQFEAEERERTGIKNLKIGYNKVFGYYIEVSKGQLSLIKEEFGYDRKQTISNSERFITPLLKEKENMILNAEERVNNLEYSIFCDIKEEIKKYIPTLQKVANKIAYYDVIQSFATIAEENKFVRANLNENHIIDIELGRHPVVESVIEDEYIPNDVKMDENINVLMITGPNMSGKSTYMRELGIIAVLNQIGSYVPAKNANLPIFDKIFTRIGASDDLVGGESTFMVEMKESANAIKNATENSLLLFDELGRGTSTYDGMSLAGAIIEYISKRIKCKTMFSTHYHELVNMEKELNGIKNVHVTIDENDGDITFLHKVLDGAVDRSYGINVAKLADLPKEVIEKAQELLNVYESKDNKKVKTVKQFELSFDTKIDELRECLKNLNPYEITPIEALQELEKLKKMC